ncbi:MAG: HAD family hydrolase [Pacificimonas sp.]|nr:HAD family hydrolase [Pacificimonas sp.]
MTIRIAMWSGPRNISTAMMRSFGARTDCAVSDEPYYGAFLKASGKPDPMAAEIIADMDTDWVSVTRTLNGPAPGGAPIWYQKHMPSEMAGPVSISDLPSHRHAFLIRDPKRMIASYAKKMQTVTFDEMGLERLHLYFLMEADRLGTPPPVVEGRDILADPGGMLAKLCTALGIDWDPAMLSWEPGQHDSDGVWAPHWYGRVMASTGFEGRDDSPVELSDENQALYERCRPHFEALQAHKLTP